MSYEGRSMVLEASSDGFATSASVEVYLLKATPRRIRPGQAQDYWTYGTDRAKPRIWSIVCECLGFNNEVSGASEVLQDWTVYTLLEDILTQYDDVRIAATYDQANNHAGGPIKRAGTPGNNDFWTDIITMPHLVRLVEDDLDPQDAGDGSSDLTFTLQSVVPF